MKRFNKKTKAEQMFFLILMFVALIGIFCVTGCGGNSCETPQCGSGNIGEAITFGCSIPGCGGCLTPGKGCNTACWPQSCKCVTVTNVDAAEKKGETPPRLTGCNTKYYGGGCLGCNQKEKNCYAGCTAHADPSVKAYGWFYGTSKRERFIGCYNGCVGCIGTDGEFLDELEWLEYISGVK